MARKPNDKSRLYANLSAGEAAAGIPKLKRRIEEVKAWPDPTTSEEASTAAINIATKVNATIRDVFGPETVEADEYSVLASSFTVNWLNPMAPHPIHKHIEQFRLGKTAVSSALQNVSELLEEKAQPPEQTAGHRALAAYKTLDLHPDIYEASSELYENGHYANAIEDAVKALNALVRLKSGKEIDGEQLMTTVFSPRGPVLRFNDLADDSDRDEQRGFMMMFSGAVAGLRNPRAHKLIRDDPERALEFIAFISLLAKLLSGAKKVRQP